MAAHSLQQEQSEGGSQAIAFGLTRPNYQQEQDEGQSSHRKLLPALSQNPGNLLRKPRAADRSQCKYLFRYYSFPAKKEKGKIHKF